MSGEDNKADDSATRTGGGDAIFQDLFDDTPEAFALSQGEVVVFRRRTSPDRYDFITPGIEQLTGYPALEFTPELWDRLVEEVQLRGELAGLPHDVARQRYLSGAVTRWHAECVLRHRDGSRRWILDLSVPLRDKAGRVAGSFGFLHDITAQRSMGVRDSLRADPHAELHLGKLPSVVWMVDRELRYTLAEGTGLAGTGVKPGEVVGRRVMEIAVTSGDRERCIAAHQRAVTGEQVDYEELTNGHLYATHLEPMRSNGIVTGVLGVCVDVTTYRETEARLLQREVYERALLQAIPDLIAVIDSDGTFTDFKAESPNDLKQVKSDVIGRNLRDFPFPVDDYERLCGVIRKAISTGSIQQVEYRYDDEGETTWWDARVARLDAGRVILLARDITARRRDEEEKRRIEEQMRSAQQLESLGVLAGGIAHDFNNLLVGIMGNADIALNELPPGPVRDCISELRTASARAAELTNLMLAYAGRGKFQTMTIDLNVVALEVSQLIQAAVSKKVTLHFELDRTLPNLRGDAAQLRQVVMNLIVNAAESYGESEGEVVIRTGLAQIKQDDLATVLPAGSIKAGRYIFLEVADKGGGMDSATLRRIFDPFFTTKFTGRGLGLSASLGILRSHGGCIHVQSAPMEGSTFSIFLPPEEQPVPSGVSDTAIDIVKQTRAPPANITGRILVVDDEEIVRRVVRRQLERSGFTVITEADGRHAVQLIAEQPELIDLVLLDLTMPGMGGEEVLVYLRSIGFKHPVVLMSGYDESETATISRRLGVYAFIRKPFQVDLLVNTLRSALADRRLPPGDHTIAEDRGG